MKSLCGNSYGCLSDVDNGIGTEMDYTGTHTCFRCEAIAMDILQFFLGEEIEFVHFLGEAGEWECSSKVLERLEELTLYQALKPQMALLAEMRAGA